MKLPLLTPTGVTGSITVSDVLFAGKVQPSLLAQAVRVYLANSRQATSKVKTRSEINRTKKKWYRQKGTGGARHGARTANIFVGGGVSHGPTGGQNFNLSLTPALKRQALISALTSQHSACLVISEIVPLTNQTKMAAAFLKPARSASEKMLLVIKNDDKMIARSVGNLPYLTLRTAAQLNTLDVVTADKILFAPDSLTEVEKKINLAKVVKATHVRKTQAETVTAQASVKVTSVAPAKPKATAKTKTVTKPAVKTGPKTATKKPIKAKVKVTTKKKTT